MHKISSMKVHGRLQISLACEAIILISILVIQGCGGTARMNLGTISEPTGLSSIDLNVALLLTPDFAHFIYQESPWGKKTEVELGAAIVPHIETMAQKLFQSSTIISEMPAHLQLGMQAVLIPMIVDIRRPDAESGNMFSPKTTFLKVKWILLNDQSDTVWVATITGAGESKQGGGLKWRTEIGKGVERAARDMLLKSYTAISSSQEIRAYASSRKR